MAVADRVGLFAGTAPLPIGIPPGRDRLIAPTVALFEPDACPIACEESGSYSSRDYGQGDRGKGSVMCLGEDGWRSNSSSPRFKRAGGRRCLEQTAKLLQSVLASRSIGPPFSIRIIPMGCVKISRATWVGAEK